MNPILQIHLFTHYCVALLEQIKLGQNKRALSLSSIRTNSSVLKSLVFFFCIIIIILCVYAVCAFIIDHHVLHSLSVFRHWFVYKLGNANRIDLIFAFFHFSSSLLFALFYFVYLLSVVFFSLCTFVCVYSLMYESCSGFYVNVKKRKIIEEMSYWLCLHRFHGMQ